MIKLDKLTKVYRTEDIESTALNNISFEIRKRRVCFNNGTFWLWKIDTC